MSKIVAIANQKGGVGKTTTTFNMGCCLASQGYKVLLVDFDPQANLTLNCGIEQCDNLQETISTPLLKIINGETKGIKVPIYEYQRNLCFIPANITLTNLKLLLIQAMSREFILKKVLSPLKEHFDYILIDCAPSLDMDLINALTAADEVLIVTTPDKFSSTGTEQLMKSIYKARANLNNDLEISGVLLNRVDRRTNFTKDIIDIMRNVWEREIYVFRSEIPISIRVGESQAEAKPMIEYEAENKVSVAFNSFVKEYLHREESVNGGQIQ